MVMMMPTLSAPPPSYDTYLHACLKEGNVVRWGDSAWPLTVYIAPFRWYEASKQRNAKAYEQMAWECFEAWSALSQGLVSFRRVTTKLASQINVAWRRVDRTSLGHCETLWKANRLYSAEISIGISDGLLHAQYNNPTEVKHTILHEVGHALGLLGHSHGQGDIMYVPHQYGVDSLTPRDVNTLRWLYKLPIGCNPASEAARLGLKSPWLMAHFLEAWHTGQPSFGQALAQVNHALMANTPSPSGLDIGGQQQLLSQMGQFLMATSNIQPSLKPIIMPNTNSQFK
jgi:hypothetical protein